MSYLKAINACAKLFLIHPNYHPNYSTAKLKVWCSHPTVNVTKLRVSQLKIFAPLDFSSKVYIALPILLFYVSLN